MQISDHSGTGSGSNSEGKEGLFLRFVGWLRDDGEFALDRGWETTRRTAVHQPCEGYRVELLDAAGRTVTHVVPEVSNGECRSVTGPMAWSRVAGYLPFRLEGTSVRLSSQSRLLYERELPPASPRLELIEVDARRDEVRLRWDSEHALPLTYDVLIVRARRIFRLVRAIEEKSVIVDVSRIPLDGECRMVIHASDGLRSAAVRSDVLVLDAKPPVVTQISPSHDDVFFEGDGVSLVGHASAVDGKPLSDEGLEWHIDGHVVSRAERLAWVPGLSIGEHTVELVYGNGAAIARTSIRVQPRREPDEQWARAFRNHEKWFGSQAPSNEPVPCSSPTADALAKRSRRRSLPIVRDRPPLRSR